MFLLSHPKASMGRCWQIFNNPCCEAVGHISKIGEEKFEGFIYDTKQTAVGNTQDIVLAKLKEQNGDAT